MRKPLIQTLPVHGTCTHVCLCRQPPFLAHNSAPKQPSSHNACTDQAQRATKAWCLDVATCVVSGTGHRPKPVLKATPTAPIEHSALGPYSSKMALKRVWVFSKFSMVKFKVLSWVLSVMSLLASSFSSMSFS